MSNPLLILALAGGAYYLYSESKKKKASTSATDPKFVALRAKLDALAVEMAPQGVAPTIVGTPKFGTSTVWGGDYMYGFYRDSLSTPEMGDELLAVMVGSDGKTYDTHTAFITPPTIGGPAVGSSARAAAIAAAIAAKETEFNKILGFSFPETELPAEGLAAVKRPPNMSGDPSGYNTKLFPNRESVSGVFARLGYPMPMIGATITPAVRAVLEQFQRDYNVTTSVGPSSGVAGWGGHWVKGYPQPGNLDVDRRLGPNTLNAVEYAIAAEAYFMASFGSSNKWLTLVSDAKHKQESGIEALWGPMDDFCAISIGSDHIPGVPHGGLSLVSKTKLLAALKSRHNGDIVVTLSNAGLLSKHTHSILLRKGDLQALSRGEGLDFTTQSQSGGEPHDHLVTFKCT